MTSVTVFLAPNHLLRDFAFARQDEQLIHNANRDEYTAAFSFETELNGEDAAEEAFDLTNNPSRQEERERIYGRGRSVSIGDVVLAGEHAYLCSRFGWKKI